MKEKHTWKHWLRGKGWHWFKNFKVYSAYKEYELDLIEEDVNKLRIEKLLVKCGWESSPKDFKYYSSMKHLHRVWSKENKPDIITGLSFKSYPPTLVQPTPSVARGHFPPTPVVIEWLQNATDEEIINELRLE